MTTMKKIGDAVRQGDVLLIRVTSSARTREHKEVTREGDRLVLALGETSLHAHVIRAKGACLLYREGVSDRILTTVEWCLLELEGGESAPGIPRHDPVDVPPGTYIVRTQREWTGEGVRNAAD